MANNSNNNKTEESKTYKQQAGEYYNKQYDSWMPWIEDKYLSWFTKDNKASYATKRTLIPTSPLSIQLFSPHSFHNLPVVHSPAHSPPLNLPNLTHLHREPRQN
jgi:hypothetical protein